MSCDELGPGTDRPRGQSAYRLLQGVIVDGARAFVVVLAMAFGSIILKLCIDRFRHFRAA